VELVGKSVCRRKEGVTSSQYKPEWSTCFKQWHEMKCNPPPPNESLCLAGYTVVRGWMAFPQGQTGHTPSGSHNSRRLRENFTKWKRTCNRLWSAKAPSVPFSLHTSRTMSKSQSRQNTSLNCQFYLCKNKMMQYKY